MPTQNKFAIKNIFGFEVVAATLKNVSIFAAPPTARLRNGEIRLEFRG